MSNLFKWIVLTAFIALGCLSLGILRIDMFTSLLKSSSPDFKVTMSMSNSVQSGDYTIPGIPFLNIQFLEEKPVTIKDITINNDPECLAAWRALEKQPTYDWWGKPIPGSHQFVGVGISGPMKFGEVKKLSTQCDVIKVEISTDRGNSTYTFN